EARAAGAPAAEGTAPAATAPAPTPQAITKTGVDLNTATEAELNKLPGINKLTAKRIMALRPFLSVNDLIRAGVSKKTIENLKPAAAGGNGKAPTK
ncbi:MAG TPA: helix-hairpin-helix domain-containing protein, partial [Planctomycetaceae bacterium]